MALVWNMASIPSESVKRSLSSSIFLSSPSAPLPVPHSEMLAAYRRQFFLKETLFSSRNTVCLDGLTGASTRCSIMQRQFLFRQTDASHTLIHTHSHTHAHPCIWTPETPLNRLFNNECQVELLKFSLILQKDKQIGRNRPHRQTIASHGRKSHRHNIEDLKICSNIKHWKTSLENTQVEL